jgi:4-hydroxybenzoate polyprenyltransferase/phosphoserine phosphatase
VSAPHEARGELAGEADPPLCVDLDGTLLRTDALHESLAAALRSAPWIAPAIPFWLLRGRAWLKRRLAEHAALDPALLPYEASVLELVRAERARGRRIVLATASDRRIAEAVAGHLGLFDEVLASDGIENLKGERKARALEDRFGKGAYDYVGDARADAAAWRSARIAYVCTAGDAGFAQRLASGAAQVVVVPRARPAWALLRTLRMHQWAKNLLVFVPLLTAHRFYDEEALRGACLAFAAFCMAASGNYVVNDLLDLDHDRGHPSKGRRALAAGDLPLWAGAILAPLLLAVAFALSQPLPASFQAGLAAYVAVAFAYSLWLKAFVLVDVFTLAGLYAVRILAGAAAIAVPVSHWLLVFSLFMFLSLALAKRYAELSGLSRVERARAPGRGYVVADRTLVGLTGVVCGQLSALVFALYITSPEVRVLYARPLLLWIACPILLYWVARIWLLAYREQLDEDPLVFALRDPASLALGFATLAVVVAAT